MAIDTVKVQINGSWVTLTKNQSTGKYEGTIAAPNITSFNKSGGYYPVTVEAKDLAGNITTINDSHGSLGSKLKLYVKEITKPTIAFTGPAAGAYLASNTPAISFQLRDEANGSGVKISSLSIKVDGGATLNNTSPGVVATPVTNGFDIVYTPQVALGDGSHTVVVNVQDNDGNVATAATRSFTIDTVPPTLNISTPSESLSYRNVAALSVAGNTNDVTSSSVILKIKLNGVDQGNISVDGSGNFSKAIVLAEGENEIVVTATDLAGKVTTVTRTVILNTVAPVVSNITIVPNPVDVGQSYIITVEIAD